jgi:2-polyprenyl-3-methyl-5-hydroxy-6-metoxy-1,4-benzoquinol methylase
MITPDPREAAEVAVKKCYSTWASSYHADYYTHPGAYPPVHQDLVRHVLTESGARTLLDAGCGPASMLRSLADIGLDLYGFDLTPSMVAEARRVIAGVGVPESHVWEGSVADPASFRGPPGTPAAFDAVICIGVLPHVPETVEDAALANLHAAVRAGGVVVMTARNQLFGFFTLNRYSYELFTKSLIPAEVAAPEAEADAPVMTEVLIDLQRHFRMDLPPVREGTSGQPGYDEVLSRVHNPFELRQRVEAAGFTDTRVLFYHFHALPPMFEARMPEAFRRLSIAMEDPEDWRGYFMASAFIITGRKR